MLFCPECGTLLVPKEDGKKTILKCQNCNYSNVENEEILLHEKVEKKKKIEVVDENDIETLPKTDEECPKCGNKEAYYWSVQTRAGDEAETRFFQCTKCGHRWRDYS